MASTITSFFFNVSLRDDSGNRDDSVAFSLPVRRIWFEDVSNDLHIQFLGHEETNIRPKDNSSDGEFAIPEGAKLFRKWLSSTCSVRLSELSTACTCIVEISATGPQAPQEVLSDLVENLVSPNRVI